MNYNSKATADLAKLKTPCLVLGVFKGSNPDTAWAAIDAATSGQLKAIARRLPGIDDTAATQLIFDPNGVAAQRLLLLGLGKRDEFSSRVYAKAVAKAVALLQDSGCVDASFALPDLGDTYQLSKDAVISAEEAVYRFDQCKSTTTPPKKPLRNLSLCVSDRKLSKAVGKGIDHGVAIAHGISVTKDLANLPGNLCTPTYLANEAKRMGRGNSKLKVSVLEEAAMQKLGMGALLSVSRGSRQPAKLIVMEYRGAAAGSKPVVLVGKGLTFDAGGISIKPSEAMDEMKYDMCGGATVFGALTACVEMQLPINVVGVVPSSENLPDGDANKPGDIVTSMAGLTIEILNTDAEGRLILCDALTYAERFEPAAVIDIATLTGACIIALGNQASGLMANDDQLAEDLLGSGQDVGDRVWRMPIWDEYQSQLDSNFADMANIGGRPAGSITAACFLSRFTKKYKWAHLDIAGTAWKSGAAKGATGRPVPLLMQFLMKRCKAL